MEKDFFVMHLDNVAPHHPIRFSHGISQNEELVMIWIFALGVLGFAIYHPGFRKVCFWIGGVGLVGLFWLVILNH